MDGYNTISETMNTYVNGIPKKIGYPFKTIFGRAILAGAMIAIGASASNVACHAITNVGVQRLIAGCVFSVGLMMVILCGAELFTGDCMVITGIHEKKLSILDCIKFLVYVYLGNFVGALFYTALTYFSGQFNYSNNLLGAYTIKVALGKATIPFGRGVASGILCNILVCGAVIMAMCAKEVVGKLLCSFFVILAFVTSGFEHCVANMYYITAGLICKTNPAYVEAAKEAYGYTDTQLAQLSIKGFWVTNMIPVTIGNILGGALFLAIPFYYLANAKAKESK